MQPLSSAGPAASLPVATAGPLGIEGSFPASLLFSKSLALFYILPVGSITSLSLCQPLLLLPQFSGHSVSLEGLVWALRMPALWEGVRWNEKDYLPAFDMLPY